MVQVVMNYYNEQIQANSNVDTQICDNGQGATFPCDTYQEVSSTGTCNYSTTYDYCVLTLSAGVVPVSVSLTEDRHGQVFVSIAGDVGLPYPSVSLKSGYFPDDTESGQTAQYSEAYLSGFGINVSGGFGGVVSITGPVFSEYSGQNAEEVGITTGEFGVSFGYSRRIDNWYR